MNSNMSFEKDSIWSLIATNGIPAMLTMVVVIIYNLADTFFIGQTGNDLMVAAVSIAAPIFTLIITIGTLIGTGGCSIISRASGCKNPDQARQTSSFCFYVSLFIGLLFAIVIFVGCTPILSIIGATENTIEMASDYLRIIAIGSPFIIFSNTMANVIRAAGAARDSMIGNMIGTVINIILDPVMILLFQWGTAGAAIATVIGNICACIYYFVFLLRRNSTLLSFSIKDFRISKSISLPVFSIGLPGALSNLLMSVSNIIMNRYLVPYGDGAVAAMGVAMKIGMIVAMLQMGFCTGILPIMAYNLGANNMRRTKETIAKSGGVCIVLGSCITLACFIAVNNLVAAFVTTPEIIDLGVKMSKAIILSGPILGIYFLTTNIMQAAGKSLAPIVTSLARQGFVYIPCLIILDAILGLDGLMYTQAISDIVAMLLSVILCVVVMKNLCKPTGPAHNMQAS
ncbi:MAG: MATE family efflux transporter [Lachnospiraceae bacterium]|nr:MATE family efflux transporter [Lachnospiraceae bacterium]